jgi:hypothetical protein
VYADGMGYMRSDEVPYGDWVKHSDALAAIEAARQEERTKRVEELLAAMTDYERIVVFGAYCRYCGCEDPACQCWNDE